MATELLGHVLREYPGLIQHTFPPQSLPLPTDDILRELGSGGEPAYTRATGWLHYPTFLSAPTKKEQRMAVSKFVNGLCERIASILGFESPRLFEAIPERGGLFTPDFATLDKDTSGSWECVQSVWQLQSDNDILSFMGSQPGEEEIQASPLAGSAQEVFMVQEHRRYVIGVGFAERAFCLYVFDRAGQVSSEYINPHEDPGLFVTVLLALFFSEEAWLGYDPTVRVLQDGTGVIDTESGSYTILKALHGAERLIGRGTWCWAATQQGETYVIKDYWVKERYHHTEPGILNHITKLEGVPKLVSHELVNFMGEVDTTMRRRPPINLKTYADRVSYSCMTNRVHSRMVLTPYAVPITHFKTKNELIGAFLDIIETHKGLVYEYGVLHRDVSVNNLMLCADSSDATLTGVRRGLLIDFDCAARCTKAGRWPISSMRVGTVPFMAYELLQTDADIEYKPYWELESLFYSILWIAVCQAGPEGLSRCDAEVEGSIIATWSMGSHRDIGDRKLGMMSNDAVFTSRVLANVDSYFNDFKACLLELRRLFFPHNLLADDWKPATHDAMHAVLKRWHREFEDE